MRGARIAEFTARDLVLPMYEPDVASAHPDADRLIRAVLSCDGLIIVSPGYHGSISGLLKNALDYLEELRENSRPYLDGRPVGCISCAYGWQAANSTLGALRTITHALRGWPTPFGAALNTSDPIFDPSTGDVVTDVQRQLGTIADQVMAFATGAVAGQRDLDPALNIAR